MKEKGPAAEIWIIMALQFLFTVAGGGSMIGGLIAGCHEGWNMDPEGIGRICLLLSLLGGIFFLIGIFLLVFLFLHFREKKNT